MVGLGLSEKARQDQDRSLSQESALEMKNRQAVIVEEDPAGTRTGTASRLLSIANFTANRTKT